LTGKGNPEFANRIEQTSAELLQFLVAAPVQFIDASFKMNRALFGPCWPQQSIHAKNHPKPHYRRSLASIA
jgi:hypothetical protein